MKTVNLYTDGACSGNPGPGGWAAILEFQGAEKELNGFAENTTNNRMELTGVIRGLALIKEPCNVRIHTDSAYVLNAFTKGWLDNWLKNGWKTAKKQPVENQDLWKMLLDFTKLHQVQWIKVKGHSGHDYNERCDALAKAAIIER